MTDLAAIGAVYTSLKIASDITKAMIGLRDASMMQSKIIELQQAILSAQQSAFEAQNERASLIEKIGALEKEVAHLKEWDAGKDKYRLANLGAGSFAYVPKSITDGSEPNHWLCVQCYEKRQRSFLQYQGRLPNDRGTSIYQCQGCKSTIRVHWARTPEKQAQETMASEEALKDPGEVCPKCGKHDLRLDRSEPHKEMRELGVRIHHLKCSVCSFTEERVVTP